MRASPEKRIDFLTLTGGKKPVIFRPEEGLLEASYFPPAQLDLDEARFFEVLTNQMDYPLTLWDVRRHMQDNTVKPVSLMESIVEKAKFLKGHPLAIIYTKTQYFSLLRHAGNVSLFKTNFERSLEDERLLRFDPETGAKELSQAADLLRRHERRKKIVGAALGATAASSAIIGYAVHRKHK